MRLHFPLGVMVAVWAALLMIPVQPALADAASARIQINAVCAEIDARANEIKSLTHAKNLQQAFDKLEALNTYIEDNLQTTFYDKVQEVLREDPTYTPPQIQIDLGEKFTTAYWDGMIQTATNSLANAEGGLKGIPAMKMLDFHEQAFASLNGVKNTFQNVGSVIKDAVSFDLAGLIKDTWEGLNTFIEDYTAVENANLQAMNTQVFKARVEVLIKKAKKTLELMKDAKSKFIVYKHDIETFNYHLKNIAHYTQSATSDPVWPLDFSNTDYIFNTDPYKNALDRLSASFLQEEFCWTQFHKVYDGVMAQALEEKTQVVSNINGSPEPDENKNVYLLDVAYNWGWLSDYAQAMWDGYDAARQQAQADHDTLSNATDTLEAQIRALYNSYWDTQGFVVESLDIFDEDAEGIVQVNLPSFSGESPYYLMRDYSPYFPLSALSSSYEMPDTAPEIDDYTYRTYPEGLQKLAAAYLDMGHVGLETESTRVYSGSGSPVAYFAVSPLSQSLMDVVSDNLDALDTQATHYRNFMADKHDILADIESKQTAWETAAEALAVHADANWIYLCTTGDAIRGDAQTTWDSLHFAVLLADLDYDFGATIAQRTIDGAIDYIQGQDSFNQDLAASGELLQRMKNDKTLRTLLNFIIGDYTTLPALPSEQGYLDFLKELEYLEAFYNLSDLARVMGLRSEAKELFQQVYADPSSLNGWMQRNNPYCVMPENLDAFQDLIDEVGIYSDMYMQNALDGFPGWAAWAKQELQTNWPETSGDEIRPNAIHHTPGMNSEGVSVYQTIRVSFNEPMDESTLVSPNVTIRAGGISKPSQGRYDAATRTLYLYPGRMLPGAVYTVTLNEGCTDLAGNALVEESWSFTTESFAVGTLPVAIDITGVEDGGSYPEAVTVGIQVSAGGYTAALWHNGEAPQSIIDGAVVSVRGRFDLLVTATQGGSRRLSFTVEIPMEDAAMDIAEEYAAPARPRAIASNEYLGIGLRYMVVGMNFYYANSGKVYLFDMLTGEDTLLFELGEYYTSVGGVNVAPTTYCSFLDVDEPWILYVKSTGAEGLGMDPADKTFSLFLYNTETQATTAVPTGTASVTAGQLQEETVVWLDSSGADPVIRAWKIGASQPTDLHTLSSLEYWQVPAIMGFDGDHVVFEIGDGDDYISTNTDGVGGADYRVPMGESLHALDMRTLEVIDLVTRDADNPVRIHDAGVVSGRAVALVYSMHSNINGIFWDDICDSSKLLVYHLDSQAIFTVSTKPQVWDFQVSESLVYYMERVNAPPYSLSAAPTSADMIRTAYDLFTHRTYAVDLGAVSAHFSLFGDYLISDDTTPRIVALGPATSSVTVTDKQPASDAQDVPVSTAITATFSGDMDPDSLTNEWIALTRVDEDGNFIARDSVAISYDAPTKTLTLSPGELVSVANYRVFIGGQIRDANGAVLGAPIYWNFQTQDVVGPELLRSVPASGSTAMPVGGSIRLVFDEAIDTASGPNGVLVYKGDTLVKSDNAVPFSAYGGGDGTLTVSPTNPLDPSTTYRVEVNAGIQDLAGNALTTPKVITFTTMASAALDVTGKLVYANAMMGGVYEVTMPGGGEVQLSSSGQDVVSSPDGSHLYFMSGNLQVWNRQTQAITTVESSFPWRFTPDFSPDGTRIIYARNRDGLAGMEIVSNSLAGDDPQVLVAAPDGTITSLEISPDGTMIVYAVSKGFSVPTEVRVFTVTTQQVKTYIGGDVPHWAPDGNAIYAFAKSSDTGYAWAVVRLSTDLSSFTKIASVDATSQSAISPTGRFLAYFSPNGLSLVSLSTGNQEDVLACFLASMGTVRLFWTSDETRLVIPVMGIETQNTMGAYVVNLANRSISTISSISGGMPAFPMDFLETPGQTGPDPVHIQVSNTSTNSTASATLDWSSYADNNAASFRVYSSSLPFFTVDGMTPLATQQGKSYTDTQVAFGVAAYYAVTPVAANGTEAKLVEPYGPVILDDQDGLNDGWEMLYFSSLAQDAGDDPDHDGLTNAQEAVLNSNPLLTDTDGDFAPDGVEIARGMDPSVKDVTPIALMAPGADVAVGQTMDLTVSGGSGAYSFEVDVALAASVDSQGQVTGLVPGLVSVTARDTVFIGLVSNAVGLNVVSETFGISPGGPYMLQKSGYLDLQVMGGSGFYAWSLLDTPLATLSDSNTTCRVTSTGDTGTFTVTVTDQLVTERDPDTVTVNVEKIPGDLNGDSRVTLEDAILCIKVMTGEQPSPSLNLEGDTNSDSKAGMPDALFILGNIQ
ncbi:MAG: Ig-like domain-containing protein [Desulfatibacillum sp.]|nr:Ig-like domain-containing protein [Desulfatibacillum sp.]